MRTKKTINKYIYWSAKKRKGKKKKNNYQEIQKGKVVEIVRGKHVPGDPNHCQLAALKKEGRINGDLLMESEDLQI